MSDTEPIYRKYFSSANLRLAWERVIRSNGRDIKDFFGIKIYSSNLDKNLERLSETLIKGDFKPKRPFKYYEPKASKTHRTKSVLYIEDAIVYQAIANIVATANYKRLADNNNFVFGSVLHPEVEKGIELLNNPDAEFYFFEYYIPLYNKFINSVNIEIGNTNIRFKLETDITGFFDSIPHSKLLMTLNKFGCEPEILDLLQNCLNVYSGTRDSITPGVGIPQGVAASFFLANVFLNELDYIISQNGYTYYRYMDDVRIYEETEEKLTEVLVLIDNFLKGRALSLNTKKTSIEEIGADRESEKLPLLAGYGEMSDKSAEAGTDVSQHAYVTEQSPDNDQGNRYVIKTIAGGELIAFCRNEIAEVEKMMLEKFADISKSDFNPRTLVNDDELKKQIVNIAYRWRNANSILKEIGAPLLNQDMIPVWLFCVEHFFWKANHFCWNLNQYGANSTISAKLKDLLPKFKDYEWVRYQILSNMATVQNFTPSELKEIFRKTKEEPSGLVRIGYYIILLKHLNPKHQLFASFRQAIRDDKEHYIKNRLSGFITQDYGNENFEEIKYWFGL
ncbi:MAG: RNA-directed DNA polymerase [Prevotellaceae bacterium]|jgi:retron-type reverse transcriptase|nr:RNA-directed DNA polymerase [Prevotellaceae bacterium]